jgi:hypothetical protein
MPNMHTHYSVINVGGTSGRKCACGSWLAHWRKYSKSTRAMCSVLGCSSDAAHGAHVMLVDKRHDRGHYIVPMCNGCNHPNNTKEMFIDSRVEPISANKQQLGC